MSIYRVGTSIIIPIGAAYPGEYRVRGRTGLTVWCMTLGAALETAIECTIDPMFHHRTEMYRAKGR